MPKTLDCFLWKCDSQAAYTNERGFHDGNVLGAFFFCGSCPQFSFRLSFFLVEAFVECRQLIHNEQRESFIALSVDLDLAML